MNWSKNIEVFNECCMVTMARYPDNHFDLAIVDTPYGIGESSNNNKGRTKKRNFGKKNTRNTIVKAKDYGNKDWDKKSPHEDYFLELKRISKNQIIFGANHFIQKIPNANSSSWIVWDKQNGNNDFADCELAWTSFETAVRLAKFKWHGMLQGDMKNKEVRIHPTQKPVSLYKWIYRTYSKKGFKIIDTHFGSGSNGIAVEKMNQFEKMELELVACEIDKEYYDDSFKRFKEQTIQMGLF